MNIYLPCSRTICHHFIIIKILNRGKTSVPTIKNGPEVISTSSDKMKVLFRMCVAKSAFDDKSNLLPDFHRPTEHNLVNIFIADREISKLNKSLDPKKSTGSDKILVVFLKNKPADINDLSEII